MAITHYRPVRLQPVARSSFRPAPWFGLLDDWFSPGSGGSSVDSVQPAVHVDRTDAGVTLRFDLPGVLVEDLQLDATPDAGGAVVSLDTVRRLGDGEQRFRWSARLADIDAESVTAELTNGVLTVRSASRPGPVPRSIEVTVGDHERPAAVETSASPSIESPSGESPSGESPSGESPSGESPSGESPSDETA